MLNNKSLLCCLLGSFCLCIMGSTMFTGIFSEMSMNGIFSNPQWIYNLLNYVALFGIILFFIFSLILIVNNIILLIKKNNIHL